jgi:ferritin-like metal-binding protein YciE
MAETGADLNRSLLLLGLRNAHAMEKEAQQVIERQLDRLEKYPQVEARLRQHLEETNHQLRRIEEALAKFDEQPSLMKDVATALMGNAMGMAHVPTSDEILKNTFANAAVESFEISAYKSLFTICDGAGQGQVISLLQPSLQEEQAMAAWLDDNVEEITRTYMRLRQETRDPSH